MANQAEVAEDVEAGRGPGDVVGIQQPRESSLQITGSTQGSVVRHGSVKLGVIDAHDFTISRPSASTLHAVRKTHHRTGCKGPS